MAKHGGLRKRTPSEVQRLEEDASVIRTFGETLAYLVRATPTPKRGTPEQAARARVLQSLRNVIKTARVRPSVAWNDPPPAPRAAKETAAEPAPETPAAAPAEPQGPQPLRADVTVPTGATPTTRPGTTAGDPFTIVEPTEREGE